MASSGPAGGGSLAAPGGIGATALPAADETAFTCVARASKSRSDSGVVRHTCRGRSRGRRDCRVGLFRRRHFLDLAVPADTELLLDLQVRESPHCFRRHLGPRRFLEVPPVALHGLFEALLDLHFLDVGLDIVKRRERVARALVCAGGQQHRTEDACQAECTHHCCPPPGCAPAGCASPDSTLPA